MSWHQLQGSIMFAVVASKIYWALDTQRPSRRHPGLDWQRCWWLWAEWLGDFL